MKSTSKTLGGCFISNSRENQKSGLSSAAYDNSYSTAYVQNVNFSREEMNDAYAKARSQERSSCVGRK